MAQEKWLVDGPKVIDLDAVRRLKVGLIGGQVSVIGHDGPGVRVEVHSVNSRDLTITLEGDSLEIDHVHMRWDNFIEVITTGGTARADVTVQVPRDILLTFGVVSASGLITGLTGDASISTVSGDLIVDGTTGELLLNSVKGEIAVRNHTGTIKANTVSGDLTASGELLTVLADTVVGDIFLDITGSPDEIHINTVTGSVTMRLEADVAAHYKINTASGRIQLDDKEIRGVRGAYSGRYGTLDKTWLAFSANTVSGNISVLHTVSA